MILRQVSVKKNKGKDKENLWKVSAGEKSTLTGRYTDISSVIFRKVTKNMKAVMIPGGSTVRSKIRYIDYKTWTMKEKVS